MKAVEYLSLPGGGNQWPPAAGRHVTQEFLVADWNLNDVERRAVKELLSSWTAMLFFGHCCQIHTF